MRGCFIFLNVASFCGIIATQIDVRLPPKLTRWPPKEMILYNSGSQFTLECRAEGKPAVSYEWRKNGIVVNTNLTNIRGGSDGTITINEVTDVDEGYYQCFARNQYGTALSTMIGARMVFVEPASGPATVLNVTAVQRMPFHLHAHQPRSFPKPLIDWYTAADVNAKNYAKLRYSQRIQFADNGDLHFAYVLPEDALDGRVYRFSTFYPDSPWETRHSYTRLAVIRNSTGRNNESVPTLAFSSQSQAVAFVGKSIILRCFFYGHPQPVISWSGPTDTLPKGRLLLTEFNATFTLNDTTESDEGNYSCTASNSLGENTITFQIRVEAVPKFRNAMEGLYNVNATEGESVTFNCNVFAKPPADIAWLQDGQPIDPDNPPKRFVFSNDLRSLTIRDVCRDCVDSERKTDLMVIQCNASNIHGYAFAQGYLNVLTKTTVTIRGSRNAPVDFLLEKQFVFQCGVISDPSRPATVRWYKTEPFDDLVREEPPYVYVTKDVLVIMIDPKCTDDCVKYLGEYRCTGDDGYRRENRTITLSYQYGSSAEELRKTEETWKTWKVLLLTAAIGFSLLFVGIVIGFRYKRCTSRKRMKKRQLPKPPGKYDSVGYDSVVATGSSGETMQRTSHMYDSIDYDSMDQVLEELSQNKPVMGLHLSSASHPNNRYDSSMTEGEAVGMRRSTIDKGIACEEMGYLTPAEVEKIGGIADQDQRTGHKSGQCQSGRSPKSNEESESVNDNSDIGRRKVNFILDVRSSDASEKKANSYLDLVSEEGIPWFDTSSNVVNPYMKMGSKDLVMDKNAEKTHLETCSKSADPFLDKGTKEVDPYLNMGSKKVNPYENVGPKEVCMERKEMNPYENTGLKDISS